MEKHNILTALIGKEPGNGRLQLSIILDGKPRTALIGNPGSVPNCVSRCLPADGIAHASLTLDRESGALTLVNLKPQNVTYVNDREILSKRITADDRVALGRDRYPLAIGVVVKMMQQIADKVGAANPGKNAGGGKSQVEVSILPLQQVWEQYESRMDQVVLDQQERGRRRLIPIIIGSFTALLSTVLMATIGVVTLIFTVPLMVLSALLYIKIYKEKDTSVFDKKAATNYLIDNYVCPNQACRRYLGAQNYKVLRQMPGCPHCGAKFTEK